MSNDGVFGAFGSQQLQVLVALATPVAGPRAFAFSANQRLELESLGVPSCAVEELTGVLSLCASLSTREGPSRQDVRTKLSDALRALQIATKAMSQLDYAADEVKTPVTAEAMNRYLISEFDSGGDGEQVARAVREVGVVASNLRQAIESMPVEKKQQGANQWIAVGLIHRALLRGITGDEDSGQSLGQLSPSSGASSAFRSVVGICFDVANNVTDSDPEWAIKIYLKHLKTCR